MPASSAPFAIAVFASSESAPKLMSETKMGMSSRRGFLALGPITKLGSNLRIILERFRRQLRGKHLNVIPPR